jgi:hypothetical protein
MKRIQGEVSLVSPPSLIIDHTRWAKYINGVTDYYCGSVQMAQGSIFTRWS